MNEQPNTGLHGDRTRIHRAVVKRRPPSKRRHDPRRAIQQDRQP
jgi:hypothetical protein